MKKIDVSNVDAIYIDEKEEPIKTKNKNQDSNIKVSNDTKELLKLLMKVTDTKFNYEMIDKMINSYAKNELTPDQQDAFNMVSNLIK